ncbi:FAD/NAD(P)-binding protein [Tsukamurella soli]|uniref:FAD/NAD(P)-binding protein n=1 Tax=Tsukamurella soli TaxID=644556 RepID=A0ABP8K1F5_9ACTN
MGAIVRPERRIGIVGVGPRGLSVLERIAANAAESGGAARVHLIEARSFGSGDVWRTDQPPTLIMNIVAAQITAYPDETSEIDGPVRTGPSLYEWAAAVAAGTLGVELPADVRDEAATVGADSYCRRSFYGHYLEHAYRSTLAQLPPAVTVVEHRAVAASVTDGADGTQVVTLVDGRRIEVDEVVLALGHSPHALSDAAIAFERFAATVGGVYLPPGNPADADVDAIAPGAWVLVRGLGLCFFDYLSLLTEGRGGRYLPRPDGVGLEYVPSGCEPAIVVGSRRGVPLHARAANEKGDRRYEPVFITEGAIAGLRARAGVRGLDFRRDCWPLIAKEVESVYYARLVAEQFGEPDAARFVAADRATAWGSPAEAAVRAEFRIPGERRWDWERIGRPWSDGDVTSVPAWQAFARDYLVRDVAEAERGNVGSPLKAGLDVLRDIRNEVRSLINDGGIEASSYARDVEGWFNSLHAFLSIGPPSTRIAELIALIDAGVVRLAGPGFTVAVDHERRVFVGTSAVPGDRAESRVLIDAMLPRADLDNTRNLVLADLRHRGHVTAFAIGSHPERRHRTGGVAVTARPFRPIRADGTFHPHRYVFGIPTEGANWVTETGIRPNVNSITIRDSDAIARAALGITRR